LITSIKIIVSELEELESEDSELETLLDEESELESLLDEDLLEL